MNTDKKIERLLEVLEHPECYSETELKEMLADKECRECYDILAEAKRAITYVDEERGMVVPDVDEEWRRFVTKRKRQGRQGWRKVAAVCATLLMLSGLSYATVRVARHFSKTDMIEKTSGIEEMKQGMASSVGDGEVTDTAQSGCVMYANTELQTIMKDVSERYGISVSYGNDKVRTIRLYLQLDEEMSVHDIVDVLNHFENITVSCKSDSLIVIQ